MGAATGARILFCAGGATAAEDVPRLLEQSGHVVDRHCLEAPDPEEASGYDLLVLEGVGQAREALHLCRRLRTRLAEAFVPILFLTCDHDPSARVQGLQSGADACLLRPFAPGEFLAQVKAFLRLKRMHDRVSEKTAEFHRVNRQLQQAYQQIDQELELARRLQQSLLPKALPVVPPVRFAVHYCPRGRVGGDFYDVFRLDEDHTGFYVADVMGHGVPAGLLTMFLKKAVRAKEISASGYRLLPPHEVLHNLNREMIGQALAENPFITMVYGLLNHRDGSFSFARAGHPHPIYVPRSGEPELWQVHGTILGVFDTHFSAQTQRLRFGDKLLFYTDGLQTTDDGGKMSPGPLFAAIARYRAAPIEEFVEKMSCDLARQADQPDDFTLLGVEMACAGVLSQELPLPERLAAGSL
jgi:sigma-B regulation protein RsbU (phosphoserine phosphatase)